MIAVSVLSDRKIGFVMVYTLLLHMNQVGHVSKLCTLAVHWSCLSLSLVPLAAQPAGPGELSRSMLTSSTLIISEVSVNCSIGIGSGSYAASNETGSAKWDVPSLAVARAWATGGYGTAVGWEHLCDDATRFYVRNKRAWLLPSAESDCMLFQAYSTSQREVRVRHT
jgi:hypothetical protein